MTSVFWSFPRGCFCSFVIVTVSTSRLLYSVVVELLGLDDLSPKLGLWQHCHMLAATQPKNELLERVRTRVVVVVVVIVTQLESPYSCARVFSVTLTKSR